MTRHPLNPRAVERDLQPLATATAESLAASMRAANRLEARLARLETALGLPEIGDGAADDLINPSFDARHGGENRGLVVDLSPELPSHVGDELLRKLHELGAFLCGLVPQHGLDQGGEQRVVRSGDELGIERVRIVHVAPSGDIATVTVTAPLPGAQGAA